MMPPETAQLAVPVAGLGPHVFATRDTKREKAWTAGTSPAEGSEIASKSAPTTIFDEPDSRGFNPETLLPDLRGLRGCPAQGSSSGRAEWEPVGQV